MQGGNALQIKALAEEQGFYDLKQSALLKVQLGLISIQEMNRVIVNSPPDHGQSSIRAQLFKR